MKIKKVSRKICLILIAAILSFPYSAYARRLRQPSQEHAPVPVTVEVSSLDGSGFRVTAEPALSFDFVTSQTFNPLQLVLSGLGCCVGVYARRYLENTKIEYSRLEIKVSASFVKGKDLMLQNIKVEVITDADLGERRESFSRFIRNCPIHNTLTHTEEIDIEIAENTSPI